MSINSEDKELLKRISELSPNQFENFVFDIIRILGFENVVWRTPGADGGRDIEGYLSITDPTGFNHVQKWHIECKMYKTSIRWPLIWDKLAHADSLGADVLFLVTNSMPSPSSESHINEWNRNKKVPKIRVWRGYNFPSVLRSNLDIAVAHGIITKNDAVFGFGSSIAQELAKLIHSAHGAIAFESKTNTGIESASALSELIQQRLQDLDNYGKFVKGSILTCSSLKDYGWFETKSFNTNTEESSFRVLITLLRHFFQCERISAEFNGEYWTFNTFNSRVSDTCNIRSKFNNLSYWIMHESFEILSDNKIQVRFRG